MKNIRNFCIIAHIDAGKSTLADRMLELTKTIDKNKMKDQLLDRMDLEREKGITIKLQPVRMTYWSSQTEYILNLIDTPGHVDFSFEVSRTLAAVEGAIFLIDATQGIQAQSLANLYQAQKQKLDIIPVINKIDLPNANVAETQKELKELLGIDEKEILLISAKTGQNVEQIFSKIITKIRAPKINLNKPLRALIFDSIYNKYKGIIAYVRIVDGIIKPNDKIKFISSNTLDKALEIGYFAPDYQKNNLLHSGEIGYIMTGLKNIKSCKVGDTITIPEINNQNSENIKPLSEYQKIKPMVYAGIYSKNTKMNKLKNALEKLALNDSSLFFEPETSKVFGFGYRCGFLGLLHLEIVKERLIREYDLDIIITTPKADYKQKEVNGKKYYIEPWVNLKIITPIHYIGPIMKLTTNIRGEYIDTKYIGKRAILYFEAPLANIIINYYDRLKSITSGYASLNYEFLDYRQQDLVKMDILVASEKIDTLSQIVHKEELLSRARDIVKKLKIYIPKQMFKISLQAVIGSKVIARENISALKKDVTAHLYGGDISRKKKLWKKQKKGKQKMEKFGKIDIPADVFIKLLK